MFTPDSSTPKPGLVDLMSTDCTTSKPTQCDGPTQTLLGDVSNEKILTDLASQIGLSIGESIASCIESRLGCGMGPSMAGAGGNALLDPTMVNVVVRPDVKEPVSFKGDGSDAHTVQEWEAVMLAYMKKKGVPLSEQAEEVMNKLVGRAREVVKVGIRSKPSLSLSSGPDPIFDILKQHFSDTVSSSMPLADFYATLPSSGERPFDYWLRLNRAMEVTEDCLRRQNKTFDNLSRDLTAMFIRQCPDTELSLIFKCKPLQQWTVAEIHEKLVEHSRDHKRTSQLRVATAITSQQETISCECHVMPDDKSVGIPQIPVSTPLLAQQAEVSPDRLDCLLTMLERVLGQQPHQTGLMGRSDVQARPNQTTRARPSAPCDVCGDVGHTTHYHCRAHRLCFVCYAGDHTRVECPKSVAVKPKSSGPTAHLERN